MKICTKCLEEKSLTEFHKNRRNRDGLVYRCKSCSKVYNAKYCAENSEKIKAKNTKWRVNNPEMVKTSMGKYRSTHPIKVKVKGKLRAAIKAGKIIRPDSCSECGLIGKVDGHHCDYALPLVAIWLCRRCHTNWHVENGAGLNG